MQALGLIETRGLIAAVESADAMLKAAEVTLLEKTYVGGGLVSIAVTGGVAAVKAAVEAGSAAVNQINKTLLVTSHVIPRPHDEVYDLIIPIKPAISSVNQNIELEESKSEESKSVETQNLKTIDLLPEVDNKEEIFSHMDLNKINKISIDKLVLEYDLEKVINLLTRMTVTKLRSLAREYGNLRIAGRNISKANKRMLLAELKEYYRKK